MKKLREERIESWDDLNRIIYQDTLDKKLGRFRSNFAYRGLSSASYDLLTSLQRLGNLNAEKDLLRNFQKYAFPNFSQFDSNWHVLSVAQHHNLPTRLLDWTYSPLVAAHFATSNLENSEDGVIWCVDFVSTHTLIPKRFKASLAEEGSNVFTVKMISEVAEDLSGLVEIDSGDYLIFFEPPSFDERIINQFGLFSMMSSSDALVTEWIEQKTTEIDESELCWKIIIPHEKKWEIRDKLDQANITERILFPGLDGLSDWLTRHYWIRTK